MRRVPFRGGLTGHDRAGGRRSAHAQDACAVDNTFNLRRHLVSRSTLRIFRTEAAGQWRNALARRDRVLRLGLLLLGRR